MLLSHTQLVEDIANTGVITKSNGDLINLDQVNPASIDIRLGNEIMVERQTGPTGSSRVEVDLSAKETLNMEKIKIPEGGFRLFPNQFILASTSEKFFLPDNIVAEYVLKSSLARCGMNHMLAGYCDPDWHNSHLTLEIKNDSQFHTLILKPSMKIGQMKFYKVKHVPAEHSYAIKGQYNNSNGVVGSGGLR